MKTETATFGGGCFWCTEAIFKRVRGVTKATSGYTGGNLPAEAIQIEYDSSVISYETLLYIFFRLHDPTTKNQQGPDVGSEYRSIVLYHNDIQKKKVLETIEKLEKEKMYEKPVITEVVPYASFYPAEEYHQDFYAKNSGSPYCQFVIDPKIRKLLDEYKKYVKEDYK